MYCGENIKIDYIGKRVLQVAAQEMSGAAIWLEHACSTQLAGDLQQLEESEKKYFSEYTHMLEQKGKNTRASAMGTRSRGTSSRTSWCYE